MPFLSSLDTLPSDARIFFFRKSVDNFEMEYKHADFKLGVQYPLKYMDSQCNIGSWVQVPAGPLVEKLKVYKAYSI